MTGAGTGPGWTRLAHAVAEQVPPAEVDGVWLFSPLRHEGREWGTAVLSRVDGDRRRIYTKFESTVQEVGSGPVEALAQLLQEAQRRVDDEHPPQPVAPDAWFAPPDGPPR